jgi:hypothetical protein
MPPLKLFHCFGAIFSVAEAGEGYDHTAPLTLHTSCPRLTTHSRASNPHSDCETCAVDDILLCLNQSADCICRKAYIYVCEVGEKGWH